MRPIVALALFCDSVRRERGGSDTIVGVLPDNMNIKETPAVLPRLSLYIRLQFDPDADVNPVSLFLRTPDGEMISLGVLAPEVFDRARRQAKENAKPYAGMIARTEMAPFQVIRPGRIDAIVKTATDEILAGHLTFKLSEESNSSPTEPPPPSLQSRGARKPKVKKLAPSRPSRPRVSPKRRR